MRKLVLLIALVVGGTLVAVPTAAADDTTCVGTLTGGPYDNVVVPENGECLLLNAIVEGNVKALPSSSVQVVFSRIRGDVQGDQVRRIHLAGSQVGQDVHIIGGPGSVGFLSGWFDVRVGGDGKVEQNRGVTLVNSSTVEGNLDVLKNTGDFLVGRTTVEGNAKIEDNVVPFQASIVSNQVGENLQVYKNTGDGAKVVTGNAAGEAVQCFDNSPPFTGFPNVAPKQEGQCSPPELPELDPPQAVRDMIDAWRTEFNLNIYGDPVDTIYGPQNPEPRLINPQTGEPINYYQYLILKHPDTPWDPNDPPPGA